jgi:hypothetical protein
MLILDVELLLTRTQSVEFFNTAMYMPHEHYEGKKYGQVV